MAPGEAASEALTGGQDVLPEEPAGDRRRRLVMQVAMVSGASVAHLGLAVVAAWPNPAVPDLQRHNTTIYDTAITLTSWQLDMLGSILAVGNLPGTWFWGWLVATIGRKKSMMLLLVPYTLAWLLLALAVNPTMMLAARVVHGICVGATFVSASTYIIELPDTAIRGALATIPSIALSLGYTLTAALGLVLRWFEIAFVGLAVIALHTTIMVFLPESPSFLAIKGQRIKAKKILLKLRGPSANVDEELQNLCDENKDTEKEPFIKVLQDSYILKSLGIVITLFFVQNFCGLMVFYVNMTRIFLEAGSTLSEHVASILVFLVQAAGTVLACIYLDRFGRRACMVASLAVMTLCLLVMGTYHHFKDAVETGIDSATANTTMLVAEDIMENWSATTTSSFSWVPLACLMLYMFASSCGVGPVPSLLNAEYFPTAVRAQLSGLCMVVGSVINFAALQLFTPMQVALTSAGLYWFYAAVSVGGIVFTFACVRETKGRALG
ncbi:facilitated trehalose transporter Tret1 isoform X2 [Procambarus clarkii]|uniref:facilitated trehalose transporter Tret1 isoform X2 n=1 Tax=Procambarus clarkii TaxID=6728 RepID=UPI0037421959